MANENELSDNYVFRATLQDDVTDKANKAAESLDNMGASADSAKVALDQINQAQAAAAAGLDKVAAAGTVGTNSFQRLQRTIDPLTASLNRQQAALNSISRLYDQGKIGQDDFNRLQEVGAANIAATEAKLAAFNKSLGQHAEATGQAAFAMRQASVQVVQFASSIATGQGVLIPFIQQFHQLFDVARVTGQPLFASVTSGINDMVRAIGGWPVVTVAAIATGLGLIAKASEDFAEKQSALRVSLSGARDDYISLSDTITKAGKQVASQVDASAADIAKAFRTLSVQGHFQGTVEDFKLVIQQAEALGKVMGTDLPSAAKIYALALSDPIAAVKQLGTTPEVLKLVSASTLALARDQATSGDQAKASKTIIDALNVALKTEHDNLTPLRQAWLELKEAIQPAKEATETFAHSLGTILIEQLTETIKAIRDTIAMFKEFYSEVGGLSDLLNKLPIPHGNAVSGPNLSTTGFGVPLTPGPYTSQLNQATQSTGPFGQSLFQALIQAESSGQQYNNRGELLVAGGGGLPTGTLPGANQHVGLGQISPNIASGFGFSAQDITTPAGNIGASAALFTHLYSKYDGNPTLVVAAYNWGEGNVDKFLQAGGQGQLPNETQSEIGRVLGTLYASGVEAPSGGFGQRAGTSTGRAVIDVGSLPTPPIPPSSLSDLRQQGAREAIGGSYGSTREQIEKLTEELKKASDAYTLLSETEGTSAKVTQDQAKRVANLKEQLADLQDPQRQNVRDLQQSAQATAVLGEADQKLIEKQQQIANYNAQHQDAPITQAQAARALAAVQEQLSAEYERRIALLGQDTSATQAQVAAYGQSAGAANDAKIAEAARVEVLKTTSSTSSEYTQRLAEMTNALKQNKIAHDELQLAPMTQQLRDQGQVLQLEISTLGQDNDSRNTMIDLLRTELQLREQFPGLSDEVIQGYLKEKQAVDDLNTTLRARQRDMDFVANQISGSFDAIGNAVAQSFVEGQGAAVNFGNVMKSVAEQIIQAFLKLAVINPILNGLFGGVGGQTLPTIFSVGNTLFGGGGISSPTIGLAGQVSNATGGGLFGGLGGILGSGLFGTSNLEQSGLAYSSLIAEGGGLENPLGLASVANSPEALIAGGGGLSSPLSPVVGVQGSGILGGASIGGLLGGVGAGFGVGSIAGGLVQHALNKSGPGPLAGAGAGALAGAAIGSVIPVIGTLIGGLIGGLVGGAGGGLIGPRPPSPYQATFLSYDPVSGQVVANQNLSGNQLQPSNYQQQANEAVRFNEQQNALGVRIVGTAGLNPQTPQYGLGFFGQAKNPAGIAGATVTDVFQNLRFGAAPDIPSQTVDVLNRALNRSFSSFEELGKEVNKVRTFTEQTVPSLLKFNDTAGSLGAAIKNIRDQFDPAIKTAQELGYAEADLTKTRDAAIDKAYAAALQQFTDFNTGLQLRYDQASANLSGDPNAQKSVALEAFDIDANKQRKDLADQLKAVYGDSYKDLQLYASLSAQLEKTLGQERLAIQKSANDALNNQAKQQATQLIQSIADYAHGLQFSNASPLSPTSQLDLAQRQFNAVSGAAVAGDANSLAKLTNYSDTLLGAARAVYGSGQGYVDIFNKVTDVLGQVANISPDNLTASIFAQETKDQTVQIVDAINSLQNEVKALRTQVAAGSAMPQRLAA